VKKTFQEREKDSFVRRRDSRERKTICEETSREKEEFVREEAIQERTEKRIRS